VLDNATGKLEILKTSNAETPFIHGKTALLTCDVWEHAYYIDYRNLRQKFVEGFVDGLVNWDFVAARLSEGPVKIAA
ncbi:MAG TPA: Fe-Mn family superoxide dismutase, partial [Alphaproteobacteria bacterium]|nr:Fe-Mn family superoxide dismutase [Alphaproteobacteria bacterium]